MTQTNNAFETDDGKWDGVIRAFWRRIQGYQKCEFNDIKDLPDPLPVEFRAHFATALLNAPKELRTPISQNEQQEAVGEVVNERGYSEVFVDFFDKPPPPNGTKLYTSPHKQIPDGWISVDIRLPSAMQEVLLTNSDGYFVHGKPLFHNSTGEFNCWIYTLYSQDVLDFITQYRPTHWMPLPTAPTTSLTSETNTEVGE